MSTIAVGVVMSVISISPVVNAWFNLPRGTAAVGQESIPFVTFCPLHPASGLNDHTPSP